jgi:hypothetical protein
MAKTAIGAPLVHSAGPGETKWLNDLPTHANPNYVVYFNDFLTAENFDTTNAFVTLRAGTGTNAIATDAVNGRLSIPSQATTDNAGGYVGLNQENFRVLDTNKKLWFSTALQMTTPGDQDMFAGFSIAVASTPLNVWTDGTTTSKICFEVIDGSAEIFCKTLTAGSATNTPTGVSMVANTEIKLDIVVFATSSTTRVAEFYINNRMVARHTTNIPASSILLTPGVAFLSGSASGTMSGSVDYILAATER